MAGRCPSQTPAEWVGQPGGVAREGKGLGPQEGWAWGVVPSASYSQLTCFIIQELKSMILLFFLFSKQETEAAFLFQRRGLLGSLAVFASFPPHPLSVHPSPPSRDDHQTPGDHSRCR